MEFEFHDERLLDTYTAPHGNSHSDSDNRPAHADASGDSDT